MLVGTTLADLIHTVEANARNKADYVLSSGAVRMADTQDLMFGNACLPMTQHAKTQLTDYVGIPKRFVDTLQKDAPDLISINVNRLLQRTPAEKRMVRTLHGNVRAWLSDRYCRLDNEDVVEKTLPILRNAGFELRSCQVTESKLYLHVVSPRLEGEIRLNDPVRFGWVLSNSEIGLGSLSLQLFCERLKCLNGMILPEFSQRRAHLGARVGWDDSGFITASDRTRELTDKAIWSTLNDHVQALSTTEGISRVLDSLREKASSQITGDPEKVVETLANTFQLHEEERKSVLYSFLEEKDWSRWGIANAVTQVANTSTDYDRGVMLEKRGGDIMNMSASEWNALATCV